MKKVLLTTIATLTIVLGMTVSAHAMDTTDLAMAAVGAESAYEMSVISQMAGRCGAYTPNGASGIAFEVIYENWLNVKNIFTENVASLTKSPNAMRNDIVVLNGEGRPIDFFQCKDVQSETGIRDIFKNVESGKYKFTKLVGTSETAEKYNAFAAGQGSTSTMIDSGISTKWTQKIGSKFIGKGLNVKNIFQNSAKASGLFAAVKGLGATIESVKNGDSWNELVGNVSIEMLEGAVIGFVSNSAGDVVSCVLISAGASGAATIIVPLVAVYAGGAVVNYALENVADDTVVKNAISNALSEIQGYVISLFESGEEIALE